MKVLGLLVPPMILVLGACGSSPSATAKVTGHVVMYACKMPPRNGQACAPSPLAGTFVSFQALPGKAYITKTDSQGLYAIELPAGDYTIDVPSAPSIVEGGQLVRILSGARKISLGPGQRVTDELTIDSGSL